MGRAKSHTRTLQSHDPLASIAVVAVVDDGSLLLVAVEEARAETRSSCSASVVKGVSVSSASFWALGVRWKTCVFVGLVLGSGDGLSLIP